MPPSDMNLRAWWPTTQSLDLVEASAEETTKAIHEEFTRFANGDPVSVERRRFGTIGEALGAEPDFYNVPTRIVVLPTRSKWTVLWNNGFLCAGYDSLCWCLTSHHRLTTLHWSAHDEWTTFQSGAHFQFRSHDGSDVVERSVHVAQTDQRWDFFESGKPLPEEDTSGYLAKRKRDRLDERRVIDFLARLGAEPWNQTFYALPGEVAAVSRPPAATMIRRARDEVLRPSRE